MQELQDIARERAIEIICGILMVVVGVGMTAKASTEAPVSAIGLTGGGLLTTFGGVLLSWVAAVVFSRRDTVRQLNSQFDAVSRNLAHSATRISRAVEQCQAGQIDDNSGLLLISQATTSIYAQIDQIQRLIGVQFDSNPLMATIGELEKFKTKLDQGPASSKAVVGEVERILQTARAGGGRLTSTIEAECPHCGVKTPASLGNAAGETSRVICRSCGESFFAHRSGSGEAFTRPRRTPAQALPAVPIPTTPTRDIAQSRTSPPAVEETIEATVKCAKCGNEMNFRGRNSGPPKMMLCTGCFTSNFVSPASLSVSQGRAFEVCDALIEGRSGSQPLLPCPVCNRPIRAMLNDGTYMIAFCVDHDRAMRVTRAAFNAWRSGMEEATAIPTV